MKKKISIVGIVGLPANYGGFETLAEYLVKNTNENYEYTVYCSSKSYSIKKDHFYSANLKYVNLKANGFQSIFYDMLCMFKSRKSDVILILGTSGCIILPLLKLITKAKIIVNVDGVEWRRDKWNRFTKFFLKFSEIFAVKYSDNIIADNQGICDLLIENYNKNSTLIAYGGSHVSKLQLSENLLEKHPFLKEQFSLKVCRIEPENNLELILETYCELKDNIVIIGNWTNSVFGKKIFDKYNKYQNIHLMDPIYEPLILNQIRSNCQFYIHGHSAGGTNPSLVEAMFLNLPIICFDVSFNRYTTHNKGLYFSNKEQLKNIILNIECIDFEKISNDLFEIAISQYDWKDIVAKYNNIY
jgi:glycosyltransferase involved in cell wall biosynthesis